MYLDIPYLYTFDSQMKIIKFYLCLSFWNHLKFAILPILLAAMN